MSSRKKLIIVGDGACGKTSLLVAYCKNQFSEKYRITVFETYVKEFQVDDLKLELVIWDTAGQEDYERLRPLSYMDVDVALVCYSIDNPESLANVLEIWHPEMNFYCYNTPIILIGNKKDLRNDEQNLQTQQQFLKREDGQLVARKINAIAFFECSAKTREGVVQIFEQAARIALFHNGNSKKNKKPKKQLSKCLIL